MSSKNLWVPWTIVAEPKNLKCLHLSLKMFPCQLLTVCVEGGLSFVVSSILLKIYRIVRFLHAMVVVLFNL